MNVVSTICLSFLVELSQTIPEDGSPVCPGQVLQLTCSVSSNSLLWIVGSNGDSLFLGRYSTVNKSTNVGEFVAVVTANDGSFLSSTLTHTMITLGYNGVKVKCEVGSSNEVINIILQGNNVELNLMSIKYQGIHLKLWDILHMFTLK